MAAANPKKRVSSKKTASHPPYKDMISKAVVTLKDRNGSSRQGIKKWILSNHTNLSEKFDSMLNQAIRRGVENGDFIQPKGPSGPLKLNKSGTSASPKAIATKKKPATSKSVTAPKSTATRKKLTSSVTKAATKKTVVSKSKSKSKSTPVTKKKVPTKSKRTTGAATKRTARA